MKSNQYTQKDPPGFEMHVLEDLRGSPQSCTLYLPSDLAGQLRDKKQRALARRMARERREQKKAALSNASVRTSRPAPPLLLNVEAERFKVRVPDPESYRGTDHPVYDAFAPVDMLARSRTLSERRDQERIETIYKQLAAKNGNLRKIGWPDNIRSTLHALNSRLPHFRAVTEFVQGRLQVARDNDLPPRIPPILLTGDPGLGKTHFCRALADVLQTTIRLQPFDNAETTSHLLGSERYWGNTQHGVLFELLALGTHANPIVILDELDKTRPRPSGMDPLAPLHSVLEPSTACALRDLSLEFTLDASLVTFIATVNDARRIPETLLSRFRVFEIQQPKGADAIAVAHEVLCTVLERFQVEAPANCRRIAADVAHLSAREILKAAEDAVTRMLADGRRVFLRVDLHLGHANQPVIWLH